MATINWGEVNKFFGTESPNSSSGENTLTIEKPADPTSQPTDEIKGQPVSEQNEANSIVFEMPKVDGEVVAEPSEAQTSDAIGAEEAVVVPSVVDTPLAAPDFSSMAHREGSETTPADEAGDNNAATIALNEIDGQDSKAPISSPVFRPEKISDESREKADKIYQDNIAGIKETEKALRTANEHLNEVKFLRRFGVQALDDVRRKQLISALEGSITLNENTLKKEASKRAKGIESILPTLDKETSASLFDQFLTSEELSDSTIQTILTAWTRAAIRKHLESRKNDELSQEKTAPIEAIQTELNPSIADNLSQEPSESSVTKQIDEIGASHESDMKVTDLFGEQKPLDDNGESGSFVGDQNFQSSEAPVAPEVKNDMVRMVVFDESGRESDLQKAPFDDFKKEEVTGGIELADEPQLPSNTFKVPIEVPTEPSVVDASEQQRVATEAAETSKIVEEAKESALKVRDSQTDQPQNVDAKVAQPDLSQAISQTEAKATNAGLLPEETEPKPSFWARIFSFKKGPKVEISSQAAIMQQQMLESRSDQQ